MSEDEFEVHGPEDCELEHAGHSGDSFSSKIAVMTAILATLGALFSYQAGSTQNEAAMFKNNAAIKKTESANQWGFYQAKNGKQNLAELALTLPNTNHEKYSSDIQRIENEKASIKVSAEKLEAESKEWDDKSETEMHVHHRWAIAMMMIQIAISLAAITLLTRKKMLLLCVYSASAGGLVFAVMATFHI